MQAYEFSYWERSIFLDPVDVVIIGSGIVGLSAAITLKEHDPRLNILILERGALPIGASTRNAGFACFGSVTELLDDLKKHGEDAIWGLVEKRWRGLERLRKRVGDKALSYEAFGGYELFREEESELFEECMDHIPAFNKQLKTIIGEAKHFEQVDSAIRSFGFNGVKHLLINRAEGQINTGKMMQALLQIALQKGIQFLNGWEVDQLDTDGSRAQITIKGHGVLEAAYVLVATNGFANRLLADMDVQAARNQVLITKPIAGLKIKGCFHYDQGYYYFRNIDGRVLLGGGRNLRIEEEYTDQFGTTPPIREALIKLLDEVILPSTIHEIDYWWSGILGVGDQKAPIIKKLDSNVVVAIRLGGMGVALGSLVGEEAAQLLIDG